MKRAMICVAAAMAVSVAVPALGQATSGPFKDVPPGHWAYQAVENLRQKGILLGYPDSSFRGKRTVTRSESAVAIDRVLKQPGAPKGPLGAQGPSGPKGLRGEQGSPGPKGTPPPEVELYRRTLAQMKGQAEELLKQLSGAEEKTNHIEQLTKPAKGSTHPNPHP